MSPHSKNARPNMRAGCMGCRLLAQNRFAEGCRRRTYFFLDSAAYVPQARPKRKMKRISISARWRRAAPAGRCAFDEERCDATSIYASCGHEIELTIFT